MFLENEAWQLCPVKASFKIMDLQVRLLADDRGTAGHPCLDIIPC